MICTAVQRILGRCDRSFPKSYYKYCIYLRRYSTAVIKDILKLNERGIFKTITPEGSGPDLYRLLSAPQPVYCGFDPTADSLHVGNLLAIIALIHCQRVRHEPIAVVGSATAQIGDPSGKTKDRDTIDHQTIQTNAAGIMENLHRIFTNHEKHFWKQEKELKPLKLLDNSEWYKDKNIIDFLSEVGRKFRMSQMLAKHSVQSRLGTREGMSFTEFTYQIFQSYDWLHLLQNHGCHIQIGGNDQLGNITAGTEFIEKCVKERAFGLTIPLVTTSVGQKIGKSEGNAIWLSANKTTPYELYQYFINTADSDVEEYLNLFTFLSDDEIKRILKKHKVNSADRNAQRKLAENVVTLVHGEEGLTQARRWTEALWSDSIESLVHLSESDMKRLFSTAPTFEFLIDPEMSVLDLVMKIKPKFRDIDARRLIVEGGVYINHTRVTEPELFLVLGDHILPNKITLLRIGKKNYNIIKWQTLS